MLEHDWIVTTHARTETSTAMGNPCYTHRIGILDTRRTVALSPCTPTSTCPPIPRQQTGLLRPSLLFGAHEEIITTHFGLADLNNRPCASPVFMPPVPILNAG